MEQSEVMKELVSLRLLGDGWITIKALEAILSDRFKPRMVRYYVNRLWANNMVEMRPINAKLREFKIKQQYVIEGT